MTQQEQCVSQKEEKWRRGVSYGYYWRRHVEFSAAVRVRIYFVSTGSSTDLLRKWFLEKYVLTFISEFFKLFEVFKFTHDPDRR